MGKQQGQQKAGSRVENWSMVDVVSWVRLHPKLKKFADHFEEAEVDGSQLAEMDEGDLEHYLSIKSKFARKAILAAVKKLVDESKNAGSNPPKHEASTSLESSPRREGVISGDLALPATKTTHYFCSHKKLHSQYSSSSEHLAMRIKV
jgi:hypothetical protein